MVRAWLRELTWKDVAAFILKIFSSFVPQLLSIILISIDTSRNMKSKAQPRTCEFEQWDSPTMTILTGRNFTFFSNSTQTNILLLTWSDVGMEISTSHWVFTLARSLFAVMNKIIRLWCKKQKNRRAASRGIGFVFNVIGFCFSIFNGKYSVTTDMFCVNLIYVALLFQSILEYQENQDILEVLHLFLASIFGAYIEPSLSNMSEQALWVFWNIGIAYVAATNLYHLVRKEEMAPDAETLKEMKEKMEKDHEKEVAKLKKEKDDLEKEIEEQKREKHELREEMRKMEEVMNENGLTRQELENRLRETENQLKEMKEAMEKSKAELAAEKKKLPGIQKTASTKSTRGSCDGSGGEKVDDGVAAVEQEKLEEVEENGDVDEK